MSKNPVGWFEIYVRDMQRAKAFYEAVFGTTLIDLAIPEMEMWVFPANYDEHGAAGALVKMDGSTPSGSGTVVYFSCDDCAVEAARAATAGGQVVQGKFSIGTHGFVAMLKDSEGNLIGLHSLK